MLINAYLNFDGRCEEAFNLYAQCLGGTIEVLMPHAGTPAEEHVPAEWRDKIMHVRMKAGDNVLMGSDVPPGHYTKPTGIAVSVQIADPAEAERVFNTLADGGTVTMPLTQTFWAQRFGMLVDRFGIPWMINCE